MHRPDLKQKLQAYNQYYSDKPSLQITSSNEDKEQMEWRLEGNLRIYWGIVQPIRFKIADNKAEEQADRLSRFSYDEVSQLQLYMNLPQGGNSTIETIVESPAIVQSNNSTQKEAPPSLLKSPTHVSRSQSSVVMRKKRTKKPLKRRLSIINGHLFSAQTSLFTPTVGSCTNVFVSNHHSADLVIKLLLNKFKVDNASTEFCLCAIRSSGETIILKDDHAPLVERVMYGPIEDQVRLCLIERYRVMDVNEEAAYFFGLPDSVLEAFLCKYSMDEQLELQMIKERYKSYKGRLEEMMEKKEGHC